MLIRALKIPPASALLLLLLGFFGWQLCWGTTYESKPIGTAPKPAPQQDTPHGKKPMRIAIMTFVTDERSYIQLSLKNKDHYARRHGYDLIVDYEAYTDRSVVWWKFNMAERVIKSGKYDWVWWLDFDTLITNTDIKLADIIEEELKNATNPEGIDYILTHDCNGLNAGSFVFRGHERSLGLIHKSYAMHDEAKKEEKHLSEQDTTVKLLKEDSGIAETAHRVPQWKLNAFPEEIHCFDDSKQVWKHGMFLLHFAGAWAHVKGDDPTGQLMKKYQHEIVWGDWKDVYEL